MSDIVYESPTKMQRAQKFIFTLYGGDDLKLYVIFIR